MTRLNPSKNIENNIQELRHLKQLTQQDLAEAVGVTRATILALERGDYNPSLELAFRVSRFFKLSVEEVFKYRSSK
jgi:putative transcriptional regulator